MTSTVNDYDHFYSNALYQIHFWLPYQILSFCRLRIQLHFQDCVCYSYCTNFLFLLYLFIIFLFVFCATVTQTIQSSYGIFWRLVNLPPCQWDNFDDPHFTGWEAEEEIRQNAVWKRDAHLYAKLSFRVLYLFLYLYSSPFVYQTVCWGQKMRACVCLEGILS